LAACLFRSDFVLSPADRRRAGLSLLCTRAGSSPLLAGIVLVLLAAALVVSDAPRLFVGLFLGVTLAYLAWFVSIFVQLAGSRATHEVSIGLGEAGLTASAGVLDPDEPAHGNVAGVYPWSAIRQVVVSRRYAFVRLARSWMTLPRSALSPEALAYLVASAGSAGARIRGMRRVSRES